MAQGNKILFWFREQLTLDNNGGLCSALIESSEIIPVFCFDPRERDLLFPNFVMTAFMNNQIQAVSKLRTELQRRGSNLLVVSHPYEKILPSLARVLNVSKVITGKLSEPDKSTHPQLAAFRYQKAREIFQLLDRHSIPMNFEECNPDVARMPSSFPRFPEINPGTIPQVIY